MSLRIAKAKANWRILKNLIVSGRLKKPWNNHKHSQMERLEMPARRRSKEFSSETWI
jgi:hypothetical protein